MKAGMTLDKTIMRLEQHHFDEYMALEQYAFQFQFTDERLEEERVVFDPEQVWGFFDEERLCSMLTIIPLEVYIFGKVLPMGGIASVATWPEERRKGAVTQLIHHALQEMRAQGQSISMLHPFSIPFYRKYGWELCIEHRSYTLTQHQLPHHFQASGRVERLSAKGDELAALLAPIYEQYAVRYNGTLARTPQWWQRSVFRRKSGRVVMYRNASQTPTGYAIYELKDRVLNIKEMVYLDHDAFQGLWGYWANHDSMVEQIKVTAPLDDELPYCSPDPRIEQHNVPYYMARIVDVEAFLQQQPFGRPEASGRCQLIIEDRDAQWNTGVYVLKVDPQYGIHVTKYAKVQSDLPMLQGDILAFSALLTGAKRATTLHRLGMLQGDVEAVDEMERLIPDKITYLADFF